jgi:hypothetical protein
MKITLVDKVTLLVAKRNSGKSVLLKYLVENEKNCFDKIFIISPTENINKYYQKAGITTKEYIFDEYKEDFVEKMISKLSKENEDYIKTRVLLILDDCIADVNFHTSPSLKKIFSRCRHCGLSLILTSQYLNAMSPLQRSNADAVLIGQSTNHSLEIICEEFLCGDVTKQEFKAYYIKETQNYGFVLISNQSCKTGDINDIYGSIRVPSELI